MARFFARSYIPQRPIVVTPKADEDQTDSTRTFRFSERLIS